MAGKTIFDKDVITVAEKQRRKAEELKKKLNTTKWKQQCWTCEAEIKRERERGITTADLLDRTGISLAWFLKLKPMLLDLCPSITYDKKERKFYYDYSLSLSLFPKGSLYIYPQNRD